MEDVQMEHGFLKAPWEVLVRSFRAGHKPLSKEVELFSTTVLQLTQEALNSQANNNATDSDHPRPYISRKSLDLLETRLRSIKRRLEYTRECDDDTMSNCFRRIRHIRTRAIPTYPFSANGGPTLPAEKMDVDSQPASQSVDNSESDHILNSDKDADANARWEKLRLDRALVDYMLREGMYDTAEKLASSQGIEEIIDNDIFRESRVVIEALRRRDCTEGLRWCAENKRRLQKVQSKLEFRLRSQEFVEHARAGRKEDAILYMKKYLSAGKCDDERMCEIQRFMALLAFDPTTSCQPYKDMYSERKWLELELAFKQENYRLHGLTRESTIEIMLKAGLASLKTRKCGTEADRKPNCPTCVEPYLSLAQSLPRGRHDNSILVCFISGEIMDENNPPMALPNGNVYSFKALSRLAEENDGIITDPRSQDKVRMDDLTKCFIM